MSAELHEKQQFESFEAFKTCLDDYEKKNGFKFSVKNSQTIEKCKVKGPFKPGLIYYERHYTCQFAGNFRTKGTGIRNCRTIKTGCPAEIKIRAREKRCLEITKLVPAHNHVVVEVAEDGASFHHDAKPQPMIESGHEDSDNPNRIDQAAQQEDSCKLLGACGESYDRDVSILDIENMTIVFQDSKLEMSDEPSASCSAATSQTPSQAMQRTAENVSEIAKDAISTASHPVEHPASPVNVSHESIEIGEDLMAVLRFIDGLKESSSDSLKEPLKSADPPSTSGNLENIAGTEEAEESTEESRVKCDSLVQMRMPIARKGKGCPKGARLNAIGLPKRKNVPIQFYAKKKSAKAHAILGWLFSEDVKEAAYSCEYLITINDVKLVTQNLQDSFNDKAVDINIVQTYFEDDAFTLLREAVLKKRRLVSWSCGACSKPIDNNDQTVKFCIMCESCLKWNHSHCVGLSRKPRSSWYCDECTSD